MYKVRSMFNVADNTMQITAYLYVEIIRIIVWISQKQAFLKKE